MNENKGFELLDILTIINFAITMENYNKNVDQSKLQDVMNNAVEDIHQHLKQQDEKINSILELLKGGNDGKL